MRQTVMEHKSRASEAPVSRHTSNLQDDILWRGPLAELAGQVDSDDLWCLELPGQASHDIHSIGTTNSNSAGSEATGIGGV